jgi:hypothetical protein
MLNEPDEGYCIHGRALGTKCFFCRDRPRTVADAMAAPTLPDHRNPRASESAPGWRLKSPRKPATAKTPAQPAPVAKKPRPPAPKPQPDRLAKALEWLHHLETELKKMQDTVAQTVAEIRAAQK